MPHKFQIFLHKPGEPARSLAGRESLSPMSRRAAILAKGFRRVGALLVGVLGMWGETTWGVTLDSSAFVHRYEGTAPDSVTGTLTGTGTSSTFTQVTGWESTPSSDGNILTFRSPIAGGGLFDNTGWDTTVNNSLGWTIEWRVKIGVDVEDGTWGAMQIFAKEPNLHATTNNALNQQTRRVSIAVGQDTVILTSRDPGFVMLSGVDNTDDFHIFRVAQQPDSGLITVWRDGVKIYDNNISRGNNDSGVNMYFGDGSSNVGGSTVQLDYFRWTPGFFEPVPIPEPSSMLLLGMVSMGATATGLMRHRRVRR